MGLFSFCTLIHRPIWTINESLYYQILCKGFLQSSLDYYPESCTITVLLDGSDCQSIDDIRGQINIVQVKTLDIICGCIPSRSTFAPLKISNLFPYHNRILYLDVDTYLIYDISELFTVPVQTIASVMPENQLIS